MKKIVFLTCILLLVIGKSRAITMQEDEGPLYEVNHMHFITDKIHIRRSYKVNANSNTKYGFLDKWGTQIINADFDQATPFFGDYANVMKDGTSGYINKLGEARWFPEYDKVYWYYHDVGLAEKDKKFALINREGVLITDFLYNEVSFSNGKYYKVKIEDKVLVIDDTGKILLENYTIGKRPIYDDKVVFLTNNNIKREGLIDMKGDVLIKPIYDELLKINGFEDFFFIGRLKQFGFYFDKNGKKIEKDDKVKTPFFSVYLDNDKYRYSDLYGNFFIRDRYTQAQTFSEGLAMVEKNGQAGFINEKGKKVIPFRFVYYWGSRFREGFSVVKFKNEKFGYINKTGEILVPGIYDKASSFQEGLAKVEVDGKKMLIDSIGQQIVPPLYDEVWAPRDGMIRYKVNIE